MRRVLGWTVGTFAVASPASAQQVSVAATRWLTDPHVMDYRVSVSKYQLGPLGVVPFGQLTLQGPRTDGATFGGVGFDLVLRLNRTARPYLVGGMSGGFLDFRGTAGLGLWHARSAGVGAELLNGSLLSVAGEIRYQRLSRGASGVSVGLRLGTPFGSSGAGRGPRPGRLAVEPPGVAEPVEIPADHSEGPGATDRLPLATAAVVAPGSLDVVAQARGAMGTPYRWGGSDANGFDCSGLIQYAYATLGISLPRRSVDQARHGRPVATRVDALLPGDILAFSQTPGGLVTHVGLYVGDGRFIHSARGGVQESRLDPNDPTARWWLDRWAGARRLL